MATTTKRTVLGNVAKSIDGKSFYIKVNEDITLTKGTYLNLENEQSQLAAVDYAATQGWIKEDDVEKRKAQVVSYWNDPVPTKDGTTFVRKESTKYQVTLKK